MNEEKLARIESRIDNPKKRNSAGQLACIVVTPSELIELIKDSRELNAIKQERSSDPE